MKSIKIRFWFCVAYIPLFAIFGWGQGTVDLPENLADPSAEVEPVKVGLAYSEGPVVDSMGTVYFSEDPDYVDGRIWKITPEGDESVFFENANKSNGLEFDPQGRLVSCQQDRLMRWSPEVQEEIFIESSGNMQLGKTNDLSIGSTGAMYFTNLSDGEVFFRDPGGEVLTFTQFGSTNGVEWIEEQNLVYLAANGLTRCTSESDGNLTGCEQIINHGVDGLTLDELGNIYTADWGAGAVKVHSPDGNQIGSIQVDAQNTSGHSSPGQGGNTSNCIFGGLDRKTLYITGDGGLYKVQMKVAGRVPSWWPDYAITPTIRLPGPEGEYSRTGKNKFENEIYWVNILGQKLNFRSRALPGHGFASAQGKSLRILVTP